MIQKEYILGYTVGWILHPLLASYRFKISFEDAQDAPFFFDKMMNQKAPIIYAFFHQCEFSLISYFTQKKIMAMVSKSKDGSILAGALDYLGYRAARGSSKKGGLEALQVCAKYIKHGGSVCLAVDGPHGPAQKVKHGVITLSTQTGIPILPISAVTRHHHTFERSWDHAQLPYPFSTVHILIGKISFYDQLSLEQKLIHLKNLPMMIQNINADSGLIN